MNISFRSSFIIQIFQNFCNARKKVPSKFYKAKLKDFRYHFTLGHTSYSLKIVCFIVLFISEYKCSILNTCSGHGECKDIDGNNSWCLCKPGWSTKQDCSGNFFFSHLNPSKRLTYFGSKLE